MILFKNRVVRAVYQEMVDGEINSTNQGKDEEQCAQGEK